MVDIKNPTSATLTHYSRTYKQSQLNFYWDKSLHVKCSDAGKCAVHEMVFKVILQRV